MNESVKNEILINIQMNFENVNPKQIFNHVKPIENGYTLNIYGQTLKFNEDGDLIG